MNGCPATAARTLRSLRTCSTCFNRITVVILAVRESNSKRSKLTVDLSQDLERKDLVLIAILPISQPCKPDARECACIQHSATATLEHQSIIPVPSVLINSKSSLRRYFDEWPTTFCCGSTVISA